MKHLFLLMVLLATPTTFAAQSFELLEKHSDASLEAAMPALLDLAKAAQASGCVAMVNRIKVVNRDQEVREADMVSGIQSALEPFTKSMYGWGLVAPVNDVVPEKVTSQIQGLFSKEEKFNALTKAASEHLFDALLQGELHLYAGTDIFHKVEEITDAEGKKDYNVLDTVPMKARIFVDATHDEVLALLVSYDCEMK